MARTQQMRLIELMILKQDITKVIEYLGKKGSFQFQNSLGEQKGSSTDNEEFEADLQYYSDLQKCCNFFEIPLTDLDLSKSTVATEEDTKQAASILSAYNELYQNIKGFIRISY